MENKEIIKVLEYLADGAEEVAHERHNRGTRRRAARDTKAIREAINLLKTYPAIQPNEPLTVKELMEMDGQPAYLHFGEGADGEWVIVIWHDGMELPMLRHKNGLPASLAIVFMVGAKLYRRPPKEA